MPMTRVMIQLSTRQKAMLDCLCKDGYTASAYIRMLLDSDLEAWTDLAQAEPKHAYRQRRNLTRWVLTPTPSRLAVATGKKRR